MAHDVFISYSNDDELTALAVCAKLEERSIRCWIAKRDLRPGDEWTGDVVDAIVGCRAVVLVFSQKACGSKQVQREISNAFEEGKTVIPFRIQAAEMPRELRLYMRNIHWLDALTPPIETHIQTLASEVAYRLGAHPAGSPAVDAVITDAKAKIAELEETNRRLDEQLKTQQSGRRFRRQLVAVVATVMIGGIGFGGYYLKKPKVWSGPAPGPSSLSLSAPSELSHEIENGKITLSWKPSTDGVSPIRYEIWRSTAVKGPWDRLGITRVMKYADDHVAPGTTYFYKVTALDAADHVSPESYVRSASTKGLVLPSDVVNKSLQDKLSDPYKR